MHRRSLPRTALARFLLLGVLLAASSQPVAAQFRLAEATIDQVHAAMTSGELTCRSLVQLYLDRIEAYTGTRPRGWMGPGLTQTNQTPELLVEAGVEYVTDWVLDDQPCEIRTDAGPLAAIPYTVELNDIPISALQQHRSDEILRRGIDHFDRLYAEGAEHTRIMAISLHPFLTGAPHRIKYLEELYDYIGSKPGVCMMTGEEILDWYLDVSKT